MLKQGNSIRKGWRPRWFWIDHEQHCLKYAEKQGEKPLGSIPFATVQARVNNSSSKPYAIDFVTPNRTYYVAAKSQEEQLAWIDLFRRATKAAIDGMPVALAGTSGTNAAAPAALPSPSGPSPAASPAVTPEAISNTSPSVPLTPSTNESNAPNPTKVTDVLNSQPVHRPVLARVISAWNVVKTTVERGTLFLQDASTQYSRKIVELRGDNLFLYSSEAKANQRRASSSSIVLTMCQVRPGRLPEGEDATIVGSGDDAIFRVFSLVTPTTTLYFMAPTVPEASRWIKIFQQIQKVGRERARADSILKSQNADGSSSPRPNFIITQANTSGASSSTSSLQRVSSETASTNSQPSFSLERPVSAPEAESHDVSSSSTSPIDAASPRRTVDSWMSARHSTSKPNEETSSTESSNPASPIPTISVPADSPVDILTREIPILGLEILDANTRRVLEILNRPENRKCADCRDEDPQWASINLGIFICLECSGIHRSMGTHISKVRSVDLDRWDESMAEGMSSVGNEKSNAIFEAELKSPHPSAHSSRVEKDMFIKAKYEQKRFCAGNGVGGGASDANQWDAKSIRASATLAQMVYQEGLLNTSSESERGWRQRWMVLKENKLHFYKSRADPEPRITVPLTSAHVKSTTLDRINTFELVVPGDVFYLQADHSSDFFHWMDMLRTSQKLYKSSHPMHSPHSTESTPDGSGQMSPSSGNASPAPVAEVTRSGWLYKQGDKVKNWKKRWFVLKDNKLTYYAGKGDKQLKGSIALSIAVPKDGEHHGGSIIKGLGDSNYTHTFEIVVTGRVYYIAATSEQDTKDWIAAIKASKKAHESRVALSLAAAKNKDLAISSPERALEAIPNIDE